MKLSLGDFVQVTGRVVRTDGGTVTVQLGDGQAIHVAEALLARPETKQLRPPSTKELHGTNRVSD